MWFIRFVLGLAIGSFLNVVAVRYDPDRFLFSHRSVGGRSHCPHCGRTLRWFELVPLASYLVQQGRCRRCGARLSLGYPLAELASGLILVFAPLAASSVASGVLWTLVFLTLLLISLIDLLLQLIPDEASVLLAILGAALALTARTGATVPELSFIGSNAALFGFSGLGAWGSRFLAALLVAAFFYGLVLMTRGRGMGMGDVKLAAALGFVFGWPDIVLIVTMSFIIGAAYGVAAMAVGRKTMKSLVPFGPFLALAVAVVVCWGSVIVDTYVRFLEL